jgi:hypothetical protein
MPLRTVHNSKNLRKVGRGLGMSLAVKPEIRKPVQDDKKKIILSETIKKLNDGKPSKKEGGAIKGRGRPKSYKTLY